MFSLFKDSQFSSVAVTHFSNPSCLNNINSISQNNVCKLQNRCNLLFVVLKVCVYANETFSSIRFTILVYEHDDQNAKPCCQYRRLFFFLMKLTRILITLTENAQGSSFCVIQSYTL